MHSVIRYIFRFDYPLCYDFINRPGDALRVIFKVSEQYWDQIGESRESRALTAKKRVRDADRNSYALLTMEPNSIFGTFETVQGDEMDGVLDSEFVQLSSKLMKELMELFSITRINRAGMRLFVLSGAAKGFEPSQRQFASRLTSVLEPVMKITTQVEDSAVILHGKISEDFGYRVQFGPGSLKDRENLLTETKPTPKQAEAYQPHAITMDIDLFDINLEFRTGNLAKWLKSKWPVAEGFVKSISGLVGSAI